MIENALDLISIHAPLRERQVFVAVLQVLTVFQSTLPYGSDLRSDWGTGGEGYFNPRSLTGATGCHNGMTNNKAISIHAPLRERQQYGLAHHPQSLFQSTLPYGSDHTFHKNFRRRKFQSTLPYGSDNPVPTPGNTPAISIHAPLRERQKQLTEKILSMIFQSTLPYGSDPSTTGSIRGHTYFNPRSLTGATFFSKLSNFTRKHFNPRSLTGATQNNHSFICV